MRKLRRITAHDVPAAVGWQLGVRQTIYARDERGMCRADPVHPNAFATTTAWFGLTSEPEPLHARGSA